MPDLKFGALCWNQYATWPDLLAVGQRADRLGYDSLWTWDLPEVCYRQARTGQRATPDRSRGS